MKVQIYNEEYAHRLTESVNDFLKKLEEEDKILVEIKYSTTNKSDYSVDYSAMIIYCEKSHYRELRLGKLLDK